MAHLSARDQRYVALARDVERVPPRAPQSASGIVEIAAAMGARK
jgi:hypothetical protein